MLHQWPKSSKRGTPPPESTRLTLHKEILKHEDLMLTPLIVIPRPASEDIVLGAGADVAGRKAWTTGRIHLDIWKALELRDMDRSYVFTARGHAAFLAESPRDGLESCEITHEEVGLARPFEDQRQKWQTSDDDSENGLENGNHRYQSLLFNGITLLVVDWANNPGQCKCADAGIV
jgi:hypothetical protein